MSTVTGNARRFGLAVLPIAAALAVWTGPTTPARAAEPDGVLLGRRGFDARSTKGGLVVHLGCGDGKRTAELRKGHGFLVHGLDTSAENVRKAREHIRSLGLYGPISVDQYDGKHLPYVDNLVNFIAVEDLGSITIDELTRVLCPGGEAIIRRGGKLEHVTKPRPEEIDEWTHFLHDASNNAVAQDSVVGPPRQLQWVGEPKWARSHDHLASVSAAVSSAGRIFYIVDEGPTAAVVLRPKWSLVARDAFNGVVLWQRPITPWEWHLRAFRSGPPELAKRLVAVGESVYVTLQIDGPLSELEAASGQIVRTFEATEGTSEIVCDGGKLFVVAGDPAAEEEAAKARRRGERPGFGEVRPQRPAYPDVPPLKRLMVFDCESGKPLWKKSDADTAELMPTTLAASQGRVFFQSPESVLCLDAASGKEVWRAPRPTSRNRPSWSAPTLVVYGDVVLSADRAVAPKATEQPDGQRKVQWSVSAAGGQAPVGELIAFSAKDGRQLWKSKCRECYNAPVDVLVAGGLVWTGQLVRANEPGITEGLDPHTGEVKRTRPKDQEFFACGMGHGRCYRNKATCRYLVLGRSGVEFIDVATGDVVPNHWTRGTCQYGVIPCNGLLYAPPHSCACFIRSKLNGFNCLAPKRRPQPAAADDEARLQRGPAFGEIPNPKSQIPSADDWPTYRHDPARSGRTASAVPVKLGRAWQADLGGKLSSLVVADGKVFLAQVDAQTVHALGADDGRPIWSYTAGGRVDSPPTVWQGRVLFGSADGWVTCLRASDGALAWRFRAAPHDRRIVACGQVESLWPVSGSVLVHDAVVHCAAGRSSYLDGGIRLVRLDAKTGRLLSETIMDDRDPETGFQKKNVVRGTNMPGALPDVLSCDGESVFMRHRRFDLKGQPREPNVPHLFSSVGFLDGSWWHRTYWMLGALMGTNYGGWPRVGMRVPAGRLLVMDDDRVFGFGRNQYSHTGSHVGVDAETVFHYNPGRYNPRQTYYQAFAISRHPEPAAKPQAKPQKKSQAKRGAKPKPKRRRRPALPPKKYLWTEKLPILVRAMVLAPDTLFLAGPPDFFATDDPAGALSGTRGGTLIAVSPADGGKLAEYRLQDPPVFDGMAAADGRLYMATAGGKVLCFGRK